MTKRVLDVGNCDHDHGQIKRVLAEHFEAEVVQVHNETQALERLRQESFDLVTINRVIDWTGASGMELIRTIKADPQLRDTAVMMITNYPEHQDEAVAAGACPGFGKRSLTVPETIERLRSALEPM